MALIGLNSSLAIIVICPDTMDASWGIGERFTGYGAQAQAKGEQNEGVVGYEIAVIVGIHRIYIYISKQ